MPIKKYMHHFKIKKINVTVLITLIFFSVFFIQKASACGLNSNQAAMLSSSLENLKLNPNIRTNKELMTSIATEYGSALSTDLTNKHPHLKNDTSVIDLKTIKWIENKYFIHKFGLGMKYLILPFLLESIDYSSEGYINTLSANLHLSKSTVPIFLSEDQFDSVKMKMKSDNYQVTVKHLKRHFNLTELEALNSAKSIYKHIFKYQNYLVPEQLSLLRESSRVKIVAHGSPGNESIGEENYSMSYKELIMIIRSRNLPSHVDIELSSCYSGCGHINMVTRYSESEIIDLFLKGKISNISGNIKQSFAYKFSREIYSMWPSFSGEIISFYGTVMDSPGKAYIRDPHDRNKAIQANVFFSSVMSRDQQWVNIDKTEMIKRFTKADFI